MSNTISENVKEFIKLGFSRQEAVLYFLIYKKGSISARDLALELGVSPNSLYRSLEKLTQEKLILPSKKWPKTYKVLSPRFAIDMLVNNKIMEIEEGKEKLISLLPIPSDSVQTKIEIIGGSKELFDNYISLSKRTKKEILIISVGEEVSEEVLLANRDCLERGVKIYFIVHKYDQTNNDLLVRWKRMGIEVRYLQGQGFHLVIFDRNQSLLSASNPKNTEERTTIHIYSQAISKALSQYFNSIWEEATPIL